MGVNMAGVDLGVDKLGKLDHSGFGDHGGTPGAVGGDAAVVAVEVGALEITETRSSVA